MKILSVSEWSRKNKTWNLLSVYVKAFLLILAMLPQVRAVDVLQGMNDNNRTGANTNETTLNPANVNVSQFGKLWTYPINGSTYAQPLYVSGISIGGGTHNVIYIETMQDQVYAYDADTNVLYWQDNFTNGGNIVPFPVSDVTGNTNLNISGNAGIESTPYINKTLGVMYLLARTKNTSTTTYIQTLHALSLTNGSEMFGGPVTISATGFSSKMQNQRMGLALAGNNIIITWTSHEDDTPYNGWVMAYNATNLSQVATFEDTPTGSQGGIWQQGRAPAVDSSGNVYMITGNGTWDGTSNFGESFLKLSSSLTLLDWFTPDNYASLNSGDEDLGSGGALLIPGTQFVMGGGKQGTVFVCDTTNLGHEVTGNGQVVEEITGFATDEIHGGPVYWNSAVNGQLIYDWANNDHLKAYTFNGSTINKTPFATNSVVSGGSPGAFLAISSQGNSDGIVWATVETSDDDHGIVSGIVRAYNADNIGGTELWDSQQNSTRDSMGNFVKDANPTVANGKVYVGTYSGYVNVYGLLSGSSGSNTNAANGISINFSGIGGTGTNMVSTETAGVIVESNWNNAATSSGSSLALNFSSGAPSGATVTWSANSVFNTGIPNNPGNDRMMRFYLDTGNNTTTTVSVSNLPTNSAGYNVYVYFDGNNTETREGSYQISGTGITTTTIDGIDLSNVDFSGTFTQADNSAGNYVEYTIGNVQGFTLSATPVANGATYPRAPVNGIQIIPATNAPPTHNPISVNFSATGGVNTNMASIEAAGVILSSNWNNAPGLSTNNMPLVDSSGASTAATLTFNDPKSFNSTGIANTPGNYRMMKFYLDSSTNTTTTVTVTNLPADSNGFKVYVYFDGNNAETREGSYQISGSGITTTTIDGFDNAGVDFSGTFTQANNDAGNYVLFTIGNVSGFNLSATAVNNGAQFPRGPMNGIQIVPQ